VSAQVTVCITIGVQIRRRPWSRFKEKTRGRPCSIWHCCESNIRHLREEHAESNLNFRGLNHSIEIQQPLMIIRTRGCYDVWY